ncbi:MAG TPA: COX15/CtaA family protein [Burkholderiales bacterium]|nr:COX15/CtaA family protein [Burkholderiales bacterium]
MNTLYKRLALAAACLAFVVVVVGGFVRLMDAGLGCPDWPGCYGELSPAHAEESIAKAVQAQGGEHGPVSMRKAWKEMFHRYIASTLGLLILGLAVLAWRWREKLPRSPALASTLFVLVVLQGLLGMWTVTLLLKPVIVTLHLLGGMTTLALLVWLFLRQLDGRPAVDRTAARKLRPWALIAIAVVFTQIALGGWVSSNYAALACIDFPTCHGVWRPDMDFRHGFQLVRELGRTAAGEHLAYEALTAIHWTHRVGALVTLIYVGTLAFALSRARGLGRYAAALAVVLIAQIALGVANILAGLPLPVAVAHNAVAAILLVTLVMINFALSRADLPPTP